MAREPLRCPGCGWERFHAGLPLFEYGLRRWWPGVVKRWVGDLVRCANPGCYLLAVVGPEGVARIEMAAAAAATVAVAPPPEGGREGVEAPRKPVLRAVSQVHDGDMRWR